MKKYINKYGRFLKEESAYQKTHRPISVTENKCDGKLNEEGECVKCGRYLKRNGLHNPAQGGSLGYVWKYADGSLIVSDGK
jgi:hypothetical protein